MVVTLAPVAHGRASAAVVTEPAPAAAQNIDNPITRENAQPGSSGWMHGPLLGDDTNGQIKGYWSAVSVRPGENIALYVSVNPEQTFSLDIYRLGWYQGTGGRLRLHVGSLDGTQQVPCTPDATTGLIACDWTPTYMLTVPADWTSGVYLGLLTNAAGYQNYVIFVVRDDRPAPYLYQQNIMTNQAYNNYPDDGATGKSLYTYNSFGANTISGETRAVKVSFDRPYPDYGFMQVDEIEFIRWIEHAGYDVTYATDVDTHANPSSLLTHKAVLDVGHDEYWSKEIRDGLEAARDAGVGLAFFAADTGSVQVRMEDSAGGAPDRVMVCYKNANIDPISGATTTVAFRNAPVNRPEQSLRGVISGSMLSPGTPLYDYVVTNSSHWIYGGTGFTDGATVSGIVGYEMDRYRSQYDTPTPARWTLLGNSPFNDYQGVADYANSSIYQAPSGAWVFSSGTIGWSRGLDGFWYGRADPRIQRTTSNLLDAFVNGAPLAYRLSATAPASAYAGESFSLAVSAVNERGNVVSSYGGTVHFTTSDTTGGVTLPPDATLPSGQGTFNVTLAGPGTQTITVSDAASGLTTSVTVTVQTRGIAFRGATQTDQAGGATSLTLTVPSGVANGDVLYAAVIYEDGPAVSDPPGWTLVAEASNAGNDRTRLLRHVAASEPASYTWTFSAANNAGGAMVAYAGVDTTKPEDVLPATASGNDVHPTSPTRSTATANAVLLSIYGSAGWGGSTTTGPSGMNVRASFGANGSFGFADELVATPATTGARAWTTGYATPWAAIAVALRVTGATPPPPTLRLAMPQTATAGSAFTMGVTAVDATGNTITSYGGTVHFRSTDTASGVVLPPDAMLVNGQGSFSATLQTPGSQTVTATDTTAPQITGSASLAIYARATKLELALPANATAGAPFAATVTAKDANGNVAVGYSGTVHFTTTDTGQGVVLPADATLQGGTGTFNVTLVTAGSRSITVADAAAQLSATGSLTVIAAAATSLALTAPATARSGSAFTVTVTLHDQFGNVATGYRGTVHFSTNDMLPTVVLPADHAFTATDAGTASFSVTLFSVGTRTITVRDTVNAALTDTRSVAVGLM